MTTELNTGTTPSGTIRVQLFRSMHGRLKNHRACVRGLGLRRMHQIVEVADTPANRGMQRKVCYMVRILEDNAHATQ